MVFIQGTAAVSLIFFCNNYFATCCRLFFFDSCSCLSTARHQSHVEAKDGTLDFLHGSIFQDTVC